MGCLRMEGRSRGMDIFAFRRDNSFLSAIRAEAGSGAGAGGRPIDPKALIERIKGMDINSQVKEVAAFMKSLTKGKRLKILPEIVAELYGPKTIHEQAKVVAQLTIHLPEQEMLELAGSIAKKLFANDPKQIAEFGFHFAFEGGELKFGSWEERRRAKLDAARALDSRISSVSSGGKTLSKHPTDEQLEDFVEWAARQSRRSTPVPNRESMCAQEDDERMEWSVRVNDYFKDLANK